MRLVRLKTDSGQDIAINPECVCDIWAHASSPEKTYLRTVVDTATNGDTNYWLIGLSFEETIARLDGA